MSSILPIKKIAIIGEIPIALKIAKKLNEFCTCDEPDTNSGEIPCKKCNRLL